MYLCFPPACPELFSQLKCVRRNYERTPFCKRASSRLYCKGARCVLSPKHPFKRRTEASACFPKMQPCFGESAQGFAANVYDAFPTLHLPRRRVQKRNAGGSPADALKSDSLPFSAPTLCLNFGTALFLKFPWEGGFVSNIQQARKISSEIGSIVINASLKTGPTGISDCPAGCLQPLSQNC